MRYQDSREPYFFPILPKLTGKGIPRSSFLRDDDLLRRSQSSPMWESNCVTYYSQKRHSVLFFLQKIYSPVEDAHETKFIPGVCAMFYFSSSLSGRNFERRTLITTCRVEKGNKGRCARKRSKLSAVCRNSRVVGII